jgi:D-3-phosphoglycerate dehydrogenase / 2-oxoglutarate reductase
MEILFIDEVHPVFIKEFKSMGWRCHEHYTTTKEDLRPIIHQFDGIILRSRFPLDEDILSTASSLKFIGRPGAGLENIDVDFCKKHHINVFRSPEGNRDAVAEHAIGMLLMLMNNLKRADLEVRNGSWKREENRGHEIKGKTIGIIGYGYMGEAFAQRLMGFDCRVMAYDKYKKGFANSHVEEVSLQTLQQEADIISLHTPESIETHYLIDEEFITNCSKQIYIINTARGKSLHTAALLAAINKGKVLGACLDVLEYESSSFEHMQKDNVILQQVLQCDRLVLSPHIAGWTHESQYKMAYFLIEKIKDKFFKKIKNRV